MTPDVHVVGRNSFVCVANSPGLSRCVRDPLRDNGPRLYERHEIKDAIAHLDVMLKSAASKSLRLLTANLKFGAGAGTRASQSTICPGPHSTGK